MNRFINNFDDSHKSEKKLYYKFYSRYHNCSGSVRFMLESAGINNFKDAKNLERYGVTDPAMYEKYMYEVNLNIKNINSSCNQLILKSNAELNPEVNKFQNYLQNFNCPAGLAKIIRDYNSQPINVSSPYKIGLLMKMVQYCEKHKMYNKQLVESILNETRRNYLLPFEHKVFSSSAQQQSIFNEFNENLTSVSGLINSLKNELSKPYRNSEERPRLGTSDWLKTKKIDALDTVFNELQKNPLDVNSLKTLTENMLNDPNIISGRSSRTKEVLKNINEFVTKPNLLEIISDASKF